MQMKNIINSMVLLSLISFTNIAVAVDKTSNSYQAGNIAGKIFIAVLVFLIVKKFVFKK